MSAILFDLKSNEERGKMYGGREQNVAWGRNSVPLFIRNLSQKHTGPAAGMLLRVGKRALCWSEK